MRCSLSASYRSLARSRVPGVPLSAPVYTFTYTILSFIICELGCLIFCGISI